MDRRFQKPGLIGLIGPPPDRNLSKFWPPQGMVPGMAPGPMPSSGLKKGGVPQSLPHQVPDNLLCSNCQTKPASVFCTCFETTTLLCIQDISHHYEKFSSAIAHPILPITAIKDFSSDSRYYDSFHQRSTAFAQGKKELRANLETMDKCCQDTEKTIDALITSLTKFKEQILSQVKGYKRKLETDIAKAEEEVQANLSQESPALTTQLARDLHEYQAGGLTLFTYQVEATTLEQMIQQTVRCTFSDLAIQMGESGVNSMQFQQPSYGYGFPVEERSIPVRGNCSSCGQTLNTLWCSACGFATCLNCAPCAQCGQGGLIQSWKD